MKIYVWDDIFTDYTSGLLVVLAKDLREARRVGQQEYRSYFNSTDPSWISEEIRDNKPRVYSIDEPNAWLVFGGG